MIEIPGEMNIKAEFIFLDPEGALVWSGSCHDVRQHNDIPGVLAKVRPIQKEGTQAL